MFKVLTSIYLDYISIRELRLKLFAFICVLVRNSYRCFNNVEVSFIYIK